MYARSTTVEGNARAMDDGIAYVRDKVMPAVQQMDGSIGLSMLCDRSDGRCIVTTSWEDHEALLNSEEGVRGIRDHFGELMGGKPQVTEWEIAILHRMHETPEGGCARVTFTEGDSGEMDLMVEDFASRVIPQVEKLDGFCSVSMMIDRETGRAVLCAAYRDREAIDRTAAFVQTIRDAFILRNNRQVTQITVMDVVLAHLRVPETV
jgi:quinol monooxygenase YgiN